MKHHDERHFVKYLNQDEINAAVESLANRISNDYADKPLVLIGVLKGAVIFMADLARKIKTPFETDFVRLSSYGKGQVSSGTVTLLKDISTDIKGKHVLIVEEIVDSGRTLRFLYDRLLSSQPASVEIVSLLDKFSKRVVDVPVKYVGKKIDDHFLIGYGLDLEEKCRNLGEIYFNKYPN